MNQAFAREMTTATGVCRYAVQHWPILQPFLKGMQQDPKGLFALTDDIWDLWPYARHGTPSYAALYRLKFDGLRSFLKPFVKWYCYQQVLQRPDNLRTSRIQLPYDLRRADEYLLSHECTSLDDLALLSVFEDLWVALLPQKNTLFTYHDVRLQSATRSFGSVRTERPETHQDFLECFLLHVSRYEATCIKAFKAASRWRKACRCCRSETHAFIVERERK